MIRRKVGMNILLRLRLTSVSQLQHNALKCFSLPLREQANQEPPERLCQPPYPHGKCQAQSRIVGTFVGVFGFTDFRVAEHYEWTGQLMISNISRVCGVVTYRTALPARQISSCLISSISFSYA